MKNIQKTPAQIEGWKPFWMIAVAGQRGPRTKYHTLAEAVHDADALCTIQHRQAFILEPIGLILPPGSGLLPPDERVDSAEVGKGRSTIQEAPEPYGEEAKRMVKKGKKVKKVKKSEKTLDKA